MSEEKSEAQLRNEAEVRRILEERGYSSASSKKATEKALKSKGSSVKLFLIGFITTAILIAGGGWAYFQFFTNNENTEPKTTISTKHYYDDEDDADFIGFENCLNAVDKSEVSLDDPEFWNKYISRYESLISCYNQYPGIGSDYDKNKLQETLSQYQGFRDQAVNNEAEYQARMAEIDAELEQNLARIQAESEAWDAELAQRIQEREAESERMRQEWEEEYAEYERQNALYEEQVRQREEAEKAKCDNYMALYGDKDARTLALEDETVVRKYNEWQSMLSQAEEWEASGVQMTQNQCAPYTLNNRTCPKYYRLKADTLESEYYSLLESKTSYYESLRKTSCKN